MENRKIEEKLTKQVVIDAGYHELVKKASAVLRKTIKQIMEELISESEEINSVR